MDFMGFIIDEALYIIPALWVLGMMLKNTPKVPDWTIPYILGFVGVGLAISVLGFDANSIIQGILVAGAAVYFHELLKQGVKSSK
jgi:hypothetical protein